MHIVKLILSGLSRASVPGVLCAIVVSLFLPLSTHAQNTLERISKVERRDGKGVVVRYHFSEKVDSFTVIQPSSDLIQMTIFDEDFDTTGVRLPEDGSKIKEVRLYLLDGSLGVDIYLGEDAFYEPAVYPDKNKRHLLLGLSKSDEETVEARTRNVTAINWYERINPADALEVTGIPLRGSYTNTQSKLKFDKIVIDPGHGGKDPGAVGYKGAQEKKVALAIALKLGDYIQKNLPDVEVVYTRTGDTYPGLEERGDIANEAEGDLFISIHADAWKTRSVRGASVYFLGLHKTEEAFEVMKRENYTLKEDKSYFELSEDDLLLYELSHSGFISTSEKIAAMVEEQFRTRARRKSRGVKQAGFQVLYEASMPAILVETGFITNPSEQRFLTSDYGQSIIASAIYRAIRDYKVEYERNSTTSSSQ
ncbi:MAG: N-acetylmuramoyl-L-alanine amidase [Bacteroidota bacterium]